MIVLALDHAPNNTGWAVGSPEDGRLASGVFRLKPWGDDEPERVHAYFDWLSTIVRDNAVSHLFYEAPTQVSPQSWRGRKPADWRYAKGAADDLDTRTKQGAVIGIIWLVADRAGIPCAPVPISSWRSRFLGTTKATPGLKGVYGEDSLKDKALRVCARRGWPVDDHNEAEALGILDFAMATLDRHYAGAGDPIFRRAEMQADVARVRARAEGR